MKGHGEVSRWVLLLLWSPVGVGGCAPSRQVGDVERQTERFGIDYRLTRSDASKDDRLLRQFFLISLVVDAAGTDEYGTDLDEILQTAGEERFLRVLRSSGSNVELGVLGVIRYYSGFDQAGSDCSDFVGQYPRLAKYLSSTPGLPSESDN